MDFTRYKLNSTRLFGLCTEKTITLSKGNTHVLKQNYTLKKEQTEETLHKAASLGIKSFPSFLRTFWERLDMITDFNRSSYLYVKTHQVKVQTLTR